MDRKTLQKQIDFFKRELLALKSPQGYSRSVGSFYYDMYPTQGLYLEDGLYTIQFSSESSLAPIIDMQGSKMIATRVFLGKYDANTNTQKMFIPYTSPLGTGINTLVLLSTREIVSITKD